MTSAIGSGRLLNIEDDSPARFLKSRILERAGFEVMKAALDLRLPHGDRFIVCEQIKASRPKPPVVMIARESAPGRRVPRLRCVLERAGQQN